MQTTSEADLTIDANNRAHVQRIERICRTTGEVCAVLGINRSTLFRWKNRWKQEDELKSRGRLPYIPLTQKPLVLQKAPDVSPLPSVK